MGDAPLKRPPQIVGNIGLYYVCYQLSRLGWNVMPTARNARGIDLLAYSSDGQERVSIQVKAMSGATNIQLRDDDTMADFWVIVTNAATDAPECFVLTPLEVRQGCKSYGGKPWLQKDGYRRDAFRHAWSRIGAVASSTPVADCHIDPA